MAWVALGPSLPLPQPWESLARVAVLVLVLLTVSREVVLQLRIRHALGSVGLGLAVFVLWVAPDQLFDGYRNSPLLQNDITGRISTSIPVEQLQQPLVLLLRVLRAALLVPIIEELFWRGFLPRWLASNDWRRVPLGQYNALAFVGTAVLFASEHGPYWDVGLLCGLVYNWYMWKTKSLGDLVLVHAVTNGALSVFVVVTKQYGYWM